MESTRDDGAIGSPSTTLDQLIEVLNDGINFYADAAELSRVPAHAQMYRDFRAAKQKIADELRATAPLGHPPRQAEGSLLAGLRQGYSDLRARLGDDPDAVYVRALEAQEDRIVDAFRDAVAHAPPSPVRDLARERLPQIQRMHDLLSALKRQQENP